MKYQPRKKQFKASNVYFDVEKCQAYSYEWWRFVDRIGGLVVFNDYSYSISTNKHQQKVRRVLEELGLQVDVTIRAPKGLQQIEAALDYYTINMLQIQERLNRPRTNTSTKIRLRAQLAQMRVEREDAFELSLLQLAGDYTKGLEELDAN